MSHGLYLLGADAGDKVRVTASVLLLRKDPSGNAPVVGRMPYGTELTVEASQGEWVRVSFGGQTGWCSSKFIVPAVQSITFDEGSTITARPPVAQAAAPAPADTELPPGWVDPFSPASMASYSKQSKPKSSLADIATRVVRETLDKDRQPEVKKAGFEWWQGGLIGLGILGLGGALYVVNKKG